MRKSTEEILEEIRLERERRAALTRAELEKSYEELLKSGCETGKLLDFTADLAGSKQIEYHYELVLKDWKRKRRTGFILMTALRAEEKKAGIFSSPSWMSRMNLSPYIIEKALKRVLKLLEEI